MFTPDQTFSPKPAAALLRARRRGLGLLALVLLLAGSLTAAEPVPRFGEYKVKAAFIYNFAKYVEWPPAAFADPAAPLVIGVGGESPIGEELENLLRNRRIAGRALLVRRCERVDDLRGVHILYLDTTEEQRLAGLLSAAAADSVLTVGDAPGFAGRGRVIEFIEAEEKLRFKIDLREAQRSHLRISSQLLKLAFSVRREGSP